MKHNVYSLLFILIISFIITEDQVAEPKVPEEPNNNSNPEIEQLNTNSTNSTSDQNMNETEKADQDDDVSDSDKKIENEISEVLKEMGLGGNEKITKEQFKIAVSKIMTKGENMQDSSANEFVEKVVNRMMEGVPEEVEVKKVASYFDPMKIAAIFQELLGDIDLLSMMGDMNAKDDNVNNNDNDDNSSSSNDSVKPDVLGKETNVIYEKEKVETATGDSDW